jgi:hypothetical protein
MTAPISNCDDLIARRSIIISAAASLICAPAIVRAASLMPVRRESMDCASVRRVLRTFNVPKPRQQLENRSNEHGSQWENNS